MTKILYSSLIFKLHNLVPTLILLLSLCKSNLELIQSQNHHRQILVHAVSGMGILSWYKNQLKILYLEINQTTMETCLIPNLNLFEACFEYIF